MNFKLQSTNAITTRVQGVTLDTLKAYVCETNKNGDKKEKGPIENGSAAYATAAVDPIIFTPVKSMHIGYSEQIDLKFTEYSGYGGTTGYTYTPTSIPVSVN